MKWLYYRFIYRHLMRLAHHYGWHHTRTIYPDGDTMLICDWCGMRDVIKRRNFVPLTTGEQQVMRKALFRSGSQIGGAIGGEAEGKPTPLRGAAPEHE